MGTFNWRRLLLTLLLSAGVAFLVFFRGVPVEPMGGMGSMGDGADGGADSAEFDQTFIDMMVPHHEGAVAMAEIALERAERAEIREMAQAIVADQTAEIDQMRAWRQAWFGSGETPAMRDMPMVGGMGGHGAPQSMDMAAEVEALRSAPEPFDLAFIDAMIEHHQSAIDAARAAQTQASRAEIKTLAEQIIAAQEAEIAQMRSWRQAWFPDR